MVRNDWDDIYREFPLDEIPWHTEEPEQRLVHLVESKEIEPGAVLDMCCGGGTNSIYLASKGFVVDGVDISSIAIAQAIKRCEKKGLKCNYKVGDVLTYEPGKRYDLILDRGCFHHITRDDKRIYVNKIFRLLKVDGGLFLQCFSEKNRGFSKALTKEDIKRYFGKFFLINFIEESLHIEPGGARVYLYDVFMRKKEKI